MADKLEGKTSNQQLDQVQYRLFYRYVEMMLICNIVGCVVNSIAHGISILTFINVAILVFDLLMAFLVRKGMNVKAGMWLVLGVSGVIQFPAIFMMSGITSIGYFVVVSVAVSLMTEEKSRYASFIASLFFYVVFMLTLGTKSPAVAHLDKSILMAGVITYCLASITLFGLSRVFIKRYVEMNETMAKQSKAKTDFLARMSHEIRTPINGIIGMNEMILRETTEPEVVNYAINARSSAKVLLELVNDILDISKVEEGKMEVLAVEYNLSDMIRNLINMISSRADDKGLAFQWEINDKLPNLLYGDDVKIRQVITNFLTNAVKYTPSGSVKLIVDGEVEGNELLLKVAVKDTGTGIKEENLGTVFNAFERLDDKNTRTIEGTGLGLNITYKLVKLMGGDIKAESVWGEGSTFSFSLKQRIIDGTPVGVIDKISVGNTDNLPLKQTFIAPEAKVLVVDDNKMNLSVFTNLLKRTQIQVTAVESGRACLECVKAEKFDVIFIDHMMPDMDGLETLTAMKNMEENPNKDVPVIALTANAISGAKEMYLSHGFTEFLTKPIMVEQLEGMLLKFIPEELVQAYSVENDESKQSASGSNCAVTDNYASADAGSIFPNLPEIEGFDWSYAMKHMPDEEQLLDILDIFKMDLPEQKAELANYYTDLSNPESLDMARIKVHALKSNCASLGYLSMYYVARHLEAALNNREMTKVQGLFQVLFEEIDTCIANMSIRMS